MAVPLSGIRRPPIKGGDPSEDLGATDPLQMQPGFGGTSVNVPQEPWRAGPPPGTPPFGPGGNPQRPRDNPIDLPTHINEPGAEPQAAPSRPSVPTPVAGGPPAPVTAPPPSSFPPVPPPPIARRMYGSPMAPDNSLLGKAGGLMGGGLGVPGILGGQDTSGVSALIQQLLARLGQGQ